MPFVCVELSEEWRLSVLTSGIVLECFAGAILYFATTMASQAQRLLSVVEAGPSTYERANWGTPP